MIVFDISLSFHSLSFFLCFSLSFSLSLSLSLSLTHTHTHTELLPHTNPPLNTHIYARTHVYMLIHICPSKNMQDSYDNSNIKARAFYWCVRTYDTYRSCVVCVVLCVWGVVLCVSGVVCVRCCVVCVRCCVCQVLCVWCVVCVPRICTRGHTCFSGCVCMWIWYVHIRLVIL